jgi:hypothetical protein
VHGDEALEPALHGALRHPFRRKLDFGVTSVNYDFAELLTRAGEPREGCQSTS